MPLDARKAKAAIVAQLTPKMANVLTSAVAEVKARCPVDTGRYRDSVTGELSADVTNGVEITLHDGVPYGIWQELGTSKMQPQPAFAPVMYDLKSSLPRRLSEAGGQ